jgi:Beta-propeller repeat
MTLSLNGEARPGGVAGRHVLKLDFLEANRDSAPVGGARAPGTVSFFRGPEESWMTGVPTYRSIVYTDLWPGIDLLYSGARNGLEYSFLVSPGADPSVIRLAYRGASGLGLTEEGGLSISTPIAEIAELPPYSYQDMDGRRVPVPSAFSLLPSTRDGSPVLGFNLSAYDPTRPLVIDPIVIVYGGYLGGNGRDEGRSIAVDAAGNAYVAGSTGSQNFPVKAGPDPTYNGGFDDAFVAKVSSSGRGLVYAGYIGGAGEDEARGVAVDDAGNAYVTGFTESAEDTFPVTGGPDLTYNDEMDAFVAKVAPTGESLVYAGYIGGQHLDTGYDIDVDAGENAYVTGATTSGAATFPERVGPDLTFNGVSDAFVAKVEPTGETLLYAGYIGGSNIDTGYGIAVDDAGNAHVTGRTDSFEATFPVQVGPDLTYNGGYWDAFVAKVQPSGEALLYAGYVGGSGAENGFGIGVDAAGMAYIAGNTYSQETTFPVKVGPDLTLNGGTDAFVAKVEPTGESLVYAGYIGGREVDSGWGIAVDPRGNAYIAGYTYSDQRSFPVKNGPDLTFNGAYDTFVARVNASGTGLSYAGYVGGASTDFAEGIAVDRAGNAYVTGWTGSTEDTFPVAVGPDLTFNGDAYDGYIVKVGRP